MLMTVSLKEVQALITEVLQIDGIASLEADAQLLGGIPEFDSMAVVSIITAIEDQYGTIVDDDEVSAELFETVGSLLAFIESKVD
jgi:acyl carrier protein